MSEWKEEAARRRAVRQTRVPDVRPPGGSKRDTKRWCRGVVGREHELRCELRRSWCREYEQRCAKCGRVMDYWFDNRRFPEDGMLKLHKKVPGWVVLED
jgi:hypothetical protein